MTQKRKKTKKVEELEPGDVVIIDGKKYKFGYRYQSLIHKDSFNLWMESGRKRWHRVKHGSRVEIVPVEAEPAFAIYYEGGTRDRFWVAPVKLTLSQARKQCASKFYKTRWGAQKAMNRMEGITP